MEYQEPGRFKAAVLPSFSNDQPAQELTVYLLMLLRQR